jgi:hypothetical protein
VPPPRRQVGVYIYPYLAPGVGTPAIVGEPQAETNGVYYIKGGDFRDELVDAEINNFELHSVDELVDELEMDKFILRIPTSEVEIYRRNQIQMYKQRKAPSKPKPKPMPKTEALKPAKHGDVAAKLYLFLHAL